jgi:hypothetical protein
MTLKDEIFGTPEIRDFVITKVKDILKPNKTSVPDNDIEKTIFDLYKSKNLKQPKIIWCDSLYSFALNTNFLLSALNFDKAFFCKYGNFDFDYSDFVFLDNLDWIKNDQNFNYIENNWAILQSLPIYNESFYTDLLFKPLENHVKKIVKNENFSQITKKLISNYDNFDIFPDIESLDKSVGMLFILSYALYKKNKNANALYNFFENIDGFHPLKDVCYVSRKPIAMNFDSIGRFHNDNGPAIEYIDGQKIYAIHGTFIPEEIMENPELITINSIQSTSNTEIQRIMIERYGWDKFIKESNIVLIHKDEYGELYGVNKDAALFVKVINGSPEPDGSYREYILPVAPNCQPLPLTNKEDLGAPQKLTALNAVASTYGKTGKKYKEILEVRT